MTRSSLPPPETSRSDSSPTELAQKVRKLEETVADMKEFETFLLNISRCFIEGIHSGNSDLFQNAHRLQIIVDGVCGIRYDHEKGLLKSAGKRKEACDFLAERLREIVLMLSFQEEVTPLKKLITRLQSLLSNPNLC